jgi:hypothetical protein
MEPTSNELAHTKGHVSGPPPLSLAWGCANGCGSAEVVAPKQNNKSIAKTCLFARDLVQKIETL